jgi:nicotinamidase-related amidase
MDCSADPIAHGPAAGATALLIVDMISPMDFEGGAELMNAALAAADRVLALRAEADRLGVPTVYVNDNFGQWHSERARLVEWARRDGAPGRPLVDRLEPRDDDFLVMKPMHSGFYSTNLPVLLPKLKASRVVITGVAADICVLFTAADAHMRDYRIWAPADCVVATTAERKGWALDIMAKAMGAEVRPTDEFGLEAWVAQG